MLLKGFLNSCFKKFFVNQSLAVFVMVLGVVTISGCSTQSNKDAYSNYSSKDLQPIQTDKSFNSKSNKQTKQACSDTYKVVRGDSLSQIAAMCQVRMSHLAKVNNLSRPYVIHIGQTLSIPKADGSFNVSNKPIQSTLPSRAQINKSYQKANWQWPMEQKLDYRFIRDNAGITGLVINCFPGMNVLAVADGEVVYVGNAIMQYGLMVMLKHSSGHMSVYAHNSSILVKEGQHIKVGQRIATSGGTGLTDRPKLYVEARYRGKKVDIKRLFK